MASRKEVKSLIQEVLVRMRESENGGMETTRSPIACPDEPADNQITRRDTIGRLSLLLAGAAAFKMQGCGACNDFPSSSEPDAGGDGGDAGGGCSLDSCSTDGECTTDGGGCDTDCSTECAMDSCSTECDTDCSTDECATDCATDCPADSCTTDCSFDCTADDPACTTDSSSFF